MKFIFGNKKRLTIEAKNVELAIKLFKISELYPEEYVDSEDVNKSQYKGYGKRDEYSFNSNPGIPIFQYVEGPGPDKFIKKISLHECINIDYKNLLPSAGTLLNAPKKESSDVESESKDLIIIGNPENLPQYDKTALRKMNDSLIAKKEEMELMMREINHSMTLIQEELKQKQKMLYILETYLGLNEEVLQIQEGIAAPEEGNLTLYQQVLYMDEEVGIWEDDGIDFRNIEVFDQFIVRNYDKFLYNEKSICAFKVRRHDKEYNEGAIANLFMNEENHKTYLLIRNGTNLYRIWSNVSIKDKLFPSETEFSKAMEKEQSYYQEKELKAKHEKYFYGVVAIQGLIERTDVLGNTMRNSVNLIKNQGIDRIVFIRDAEQEFWITSGRLTWREFVTKNKETICQGTRVVLTDWISVNKDNEDRFYPFRPGSSPDRNEIYEVDEYNSEEERKRRYSYGYCLKIKYLPKDTIYKRYESYTRKKRVHCWLYSSEVINFDDITIEDCEYYQKNRIERPQYLKLLPTLYFIKTQKLKEQALENEFIKCILGILEWGEDRSPEVQTAIDWWKLKNKWKRGLMKDDAKAVRMITKRLNNTEID